MANSPSLTKKRVEHIDIAKGISILLVALNHSHFIAFAENFSYRMSIFRMPLFFFMGGVFFSYAAEYKAFIARRADALLKPYIVVAFCVTAVMFVLEGSGKLRLFRFAYTNGTILENPWLPMWFLPHLFAVHLFSYFIYRYTPYGKISARSKWLVLASMLLLGFIVMDFYSHPIYMTMWGVDVRVFGLPFSIDVLMVSSVYFLAGSLLRDQVKAMQLHRVKLLLASTALLLTLLIFEVSINLVMRVAGIHLLAIAGSALGIYSVIGISMLIGKVDWLRKLFLACGEASLFILIFHVLIDSFLVRSIGIDNWSAVPRFVATLITFLLCISIPVGMKWYTKQNRFLALLMLPKSQRVPVLATR